MMPISASASDSSTISPTVTGNQSGGSNKIQINAAESIFPFTNQGNGGGSPWLLVGVLVAVALVILLIFRKK